jgi:serine protease Do
MLRKTYDPAARPLALAAIGVVAASALVWTARADVRVSDSPVADLVEQVSPAVVTILAEQERGAARGAQPFNPFEGSPFEEFFRRFGMPRPDLGPDMGAPRQRAPRPAPVSQGSGFVIEQDGYIVTNHHVVDSAVRVTVRFPDDREFPAEIVGTDPQTDLALLKIDADGLPHLPLGESERLRVGESVVAVGNPFGLGGTVTTGIVSGLARDINAGPYVDFIQTDAAINRGNSGGPLLNLSGEVIGVNAAIYSPSGGNVGVGFAIPADTVKTVVAQLRETGSVERGWLGVTIQRVTPDIADALGLDAPRGALVSDVLRDAPARDALRSGDLILSFDGRDVRESRDLPRLVGATRAGSTVDVVVLRQGREETLQVTVGALEQRSASAQPAAEPAEPRLGAALAPADAQTLAALGVKAGVAVASVEPEGPAARAGLRPGDVILRIGEREVSSPAEAVEAVAEAKGGALLMLVARDGGRLFLGVPLG